MGVVGCWVGVAVTGRPNPDARTTLTFLLLCQHTLAAGACMFRILHFGFVIDILLVCAAAKVETQLV